MTKKSAANFAWHNAFQNEGDFALFQDKISVHINQKKYLRNEILFFA
jgi:hypothetical protein